MNLAEASSGGNANVPGHEGVKFGLNVYWAQQMNGDWVDRTIQRLPRWMHAPAYIISILIWWVGALARAGHHARRRLPDRLAAAVPRMTPASTASCWRRSPCWCGG